MKPTQLPDVYFDNFQNWLDKNPLRQWRQSQKERVTRSMLAHILGVSAETVKNYEKGISRPKPELLENNLGSDGWQKRWDEWIANKPQLKRIA